jgi:hypothetical protein
LRGCRAGASHKSDTGCLQVNLGKRDCQAPLRIFPEKQMPLAPHQKSWTDIDISPMVPEEFAQFRPLTADALMFFLSIYRSRG